jgi:hypothetical protein
MVVLSCWPADSWGPKNPIHGVVGQNYSQNNTMMLQAFPHSLSIRNAEQ